MLIVCEGEKTEPGYLTQLRAAWRIPSATIQVVPAAGVPQTLVTEAIRRKEQEAYDEVWVVFDRDKHVDVEGALQRALQKGFLVAFSNPCFELWFVLHYSYSSAPYVDHHDPQSQARRLLRADGLEYEKATDVYATLAGRMQTAVTNAERLAMHHISAGSQAMCSAVVADLRARLPALPSSKEEKDARHEVRRKQFDEWCTANPSTSVYLLVQRLLALADPPA